MESRDGSKRRHNFFPWELVVTTVIGCVLVVITNHRHKELGGAEAPSPKLSISNHIDFKSLIYLTLVTVMTNFLNF